MSSLIPWFWVVGIWNSAGQIIFLFGYIFFCMDCALSILLCFISYQSLPHFHFLEICDVLSADSIILLILLFIVSCYTFWIFYFFIVLSIGRGKDKCLWLACYFALKLSRLYCFKNLYDFWFLCRFKGSELVLSSPERTTVEKMDWVDYCFSYCRFTLKVNSIGHRTNNFEGIILVCKWARFHPNFECPLGYVTIKFFAGFFQGDNSIYLVVFKLKKALIF